ncbi:PTS mannose/fructose/sorbose/N-acetylgalactosamine transporter subunit IIC [Clostridium botulinum]|uniref:PTS N-acetylgalactosamine transporter subunit IIC n=1 Tax=Clostridium botulinum TaxID=1491 RepID=A0A9Q1UWQ7_CLOBO|nr:PTS mannose/fructose/sorbose/N-acetylgalactosamine transporter subunit IIC [Clostridium botulinum]KEI01225.1 PTS N-acetylgalactosamine transporter subunit IIC [Clostridium botulinum D str. 16868]KEI04837.1 PTS N-acetylgalactosamine transporter subunit IIC [Clostridium botulinum C/D str. Sp77]KLU75914.1 PTS N-acetylgalactosamine transporter subunit IIC [Clostridium botulinum V891]KOA75644.1 PTS N-acetylgalactosamine transporter subunit IIC [Clostridium botulinum]KOA76801.1 PTS N-acetylgalact
MEISILQCILIGVWTAFCLAGMLLGIYTNRCIILAFGVGLILGDMPTALAMGAVGELAFMGFGVGAGGTVPPNPMGPGIVGTIMAITMKGQGMDPGTALALSFPFAVAFQFLITATYTFATALSGIATKALEKKKFTKFRLAANLTIVVFIIVGFVIGFAGSYSAEGLKFVIELIPAWLITGLSVAGQMLPAIGFAMILTVMSKEELIPFVILGYISIAYLKLPVIGVAFLGTMFALLEYYRTKNKSVDNSLNQKEEVEFEDGI